MAQSVRSAGLDSGINKLHSRAKSLAATFDQGNRATPRYIDEAIVLDREALEFCESGHHMRAVSLTSLAIHLWTRYNEFGIMRDLEEAIALDREALFLCPQGHPQRSMSLNNLANCLFTRYNQLGTLQDLEEAIVLYREALSLRPQGHPHRSMSLNNLANCLTTRYNQLGVLQDLEEAAVLYREALALRPRGHPGRSMSLNNLASCLFTRYNQLGALQDFKEAIVLYRESLSLCPQGHPHRSSSLNNLANCLFTRCKQSSVLQDLEEAIVLYREALSLCPQGHPCRSSSLNGLASCLFTRYNQLGVLQDLEEAIVLSREALSLCPPGHPDRSSSLNSLAAHLSVRYKQLGILQDLEDSLVLHREALSFRPHGHPDRSSSLNNLANCLAIRYNQLGVLQDLEEAIVVSREALSYRPLEHPDRSSSLNSLAAHLSTRYNQLGTLQDLEEAITLHREALSLRPQGHPDRSMSLNNLANCLSNRYDQLGVLQDLQEATVVSREALSFRPPGHPDRSWSLNNLANCLFTRYNQLGVLQDLEEAVVLWREALSFCPPGHPDRSLYLNDFANSLSARYDQLDVLQDLQEAIDLYREALSLFPQGHPHRSSSLNNLANCLFTRYKQSGVLQDLEDATALRQEALSLCLQGHPDHSTFLNNLATCLVARYHHLVSEHDLRDTSTTSDLQEVFTLYARLADISNTVSSSDLAASQSWIRAAENFVHPSMLRAYETSLRFLVEHLSLLPALPQHLDVLKKHTSSLAVDAFSACLRNSAPQRAVELLEQGRGVFWNQLIRLRSQIDDVVASGPAGERLASEFTQLCSLIRTVLHSPGKDQHEQLCRANLEMQRVVAAIRELLGCSRFLLSSLFPDLRRAATGGPVIIVNASQYGCDALVVFDDRDPVHVPLSITKQYVQHMSSTLRIMTRRAMTTDAPKILGRMLRELWDDVVFPIVSVLQTTCPLQSRIWWCPTAEFSVLPLHAAGPYRKGQLNLSALYVSSYTPTLSALIHARRPCSSKSRCDVKRFVGVGQANAPGQGKLFSVGSELAKIGQFVKDAATFTVIEGEESCIPRAAEELRKNAWVHFACHGLANDKKPFESAFALSDGDFTIERIIRCDLEDAEFAYLSACHTTVGDEDSPDEMIHLASAMQFIGFRSVIGTMWAVDDGETNKITSTFYSLMKDASGRLDHTRAAYALNRTMRTIDVPIDQRVLYVHIGA